MITIWTSVQCTVQCLFLGSRIWLLIAVCDHSSVHTLLFFLSGSLTKSVYKDPHCTTFTVLLFKVSTFLVLMLTNAWFSF